MDILYSNVIEQHEGWGAEYFVNKGFNKIGHHTFCIDYRKYRDVIYSKIIEAPKCDVFFLQRGDNFPLSIINSLQIPKLFWASELVSRRRDQDRLFKFGNFDHIFLRTTECINTIVGKGWVKRETCSILLSGFDQSIFKPNFETHKDIDVLFVGSLTKRRKEWLDIIDKYHNLQIKTAFGKDMVDLINRSKIILNIHAEDFLDTETRVFEVLGCGGFLLSETLSPDNPFSDEELIQFETLDNGLEKISHYLQDDDKRNYIASNGYKTAITGHTYTLRAKQIADIMLREIDKHQKTKKNIDKCMLQRLRMKEIINMKGNLILKNVKKMYKKLRN
jgi:hypothetical protein